MIKSLENTFKLALLDLIRFFLLESSTFVTLNSPFQPIGNDEKVR